jgi:diguanylate cyclase
MIRSNDVRATPAVGGASMRRAVTSLAASDLAFGDIDLLYHAVQARLALTTTDEFTNHCAAHGDDPTTRIRATVLECVAELEHLHATMTYEVGRRRLLEQTVSDLQGVLASVQAELTGTQAGEREARHRALHDSLTLLPNAALFRTRLDAELARPGAQTVAVLCLDLDDFKAINDVHGRETGDAVLRLVAVRLIGAIRAEDVVSRIGGDEFACLLTGVPDREHLSHLACKLFDAVANPLKVGSLSLSVRPSIGVAMCPAHGMTSDALIMNANVAMYRAERQKCGYAFFAERSHDGERCGDSSIFDRMTLTGVSGDWPAHRAN